MDTDKEISAFPSVSSVKSVVNFHFSMAYGAQRVKRFTPRTPPGAERAAPTAFQRTSLHTKCNTEDGGCKNFSPRNTQITQKSNPKSGGASSRETLTRHAQPHPAPSRPPGALRQEDFEQKGTKVTKKKPRISDTIALPASTMTPAWVAQELDMGRWGRVAQLLKGKRKSANIKDQIQVQRTFDRRTGELNDSLPVLLVLLCF